jgi:acetolactate synthase-1/3 small subunit
MRHIIGILLQNEFGALSRVAGLFASRGYNIESLSVAITDDPSLSRITLVTTGTAAAIQQVVNQLNKLIDVIAVDDMTGEDHLERELAIVKLRLRPGQREAIRSLVQQCAGRVLADERDCQVVELAASEADVSELIRQLASKAELLEIVRSGALAMSRQEHTLHVVES